MNDTFTIFALDVLKVPRHHRQMFARYDRSMKLADTLHRIGLYRLEALIRWTAPCELRCSAIRSTVGCDRCGDFWGVMHWPMAWHGIYCHNCCPECNREQFKPMPIRILSRRWLEALGVKPTEFLLTHVCLMGDAELREYGMARRWDPSKAYLPENRFTLEYLDLVLPKHVYLPNRPWLLEKVLAGVRRWQ